MDENRPASPPPLRAYTASQQQQGREGKKANGKRSQQQQQQQRRRPAPRFRKNEAPVVFDEDARREFLTGFRKRKQARLEQGRERAKLREKEEHRRMRGEARKARKQQAEENVRAERVAYGGGSDEDDYEEVADDSDPPSPSAFENEDHHTTVTVQTWDPETGEIGGDDNDGSTSASAPPPSTKRVRKDALPPSSRRVAKKLKSAEVTRQRDTPANAAGRKRPVAHEISSLMDDGTVLGSTNARDIEESARSKADKTMQGNDEDSGASRRKNSKAFSRPFRYESKLERAMAKAAQHEANAKFAEKRKEAAISSGHRNSNSSKSRGKGGKTRGKGKRR